MNEKIEQLALQCGAWHQVYDQNLLKINEYFNYEKFAELIVRECISIVEPTSHHEAFAQGYVGGVDGLDLLYGKVNQIKQHFGVEE